MPTFTELKNGTAPFLFGTALPAVLIPPYFMLTNASPREGAGLWGLLAGLVITVLILCDSVRFSGEEWQHGCPFPAGSRCKYRNRRSAFYTNGRYCLLPFLYIGTD